MNSDHNSMVAHSSRWDDPPEDYSCPFSWVFKGIKFPCDLQDGHSGPHLNYPKEKGHDAVIIWNAPEEGSL